MKKNLLLICSSAALLFSCNGADKPIGEKVKVTANVVNTTEATVKLSVSEATVGSDFATVFTVVKANEEDWKLPFDLTAVKSGSHDLTSSDYTYAPNSKYSTADFKIAGDKVKGDIVITINLTKEEHPLPTDWHEVTDEKAFEIAKNIASHNETNLPKRLSSLVNYEITSDGKTVTYNDCISNWDAEMAFQDMDSPVIKTPVISDGEVSLMRSYYTYKDNKIYSLKRTGDVKQPAEIIECKSEDEAKNTIMKNITDNSHRLHCSDLIDLPKKIKTDIEHKFMSNDDSTSLYIYEHFKQEYNANATEVKTTTVFSNYLITNIIQDVTSPDSHTVSTSTKVDYESKVVIPDEAKNPEEWLTE